MSKEKKEEIEKSLENTLRLLFFSKLMQTLLLSVITGHSHFMTSDLQTGLSQGEVVGCIVWWAQTLLR